VHEATQSSNTTTLRKLQDRTSCHRAWFMASVSFGMTLTLQSNAVETAIYMSTRPTTKHWGIRHTPTEWEWEPTHEWNKWMLPHVACKPSTSSTCQSKMLCRNQPNDIHWQLGSHVSASCLLMWPFWLEDRASLATCAMRNVAILISQLQCGNVAHLSIWAPCCKCS